MSDNVFKFKKDAELVLAEAQDLQDNVSFDSLLIIGQVEDRQVVLATKNMTDPVAAFGLMCVLNKIVNASADEDLDA